MLVSANQPFVQQLPGCPRVSVQVLQRHGSMAPLCLQQITATVPCACVCVSVWLKPDGSWCLMISQALSGGRGGRSNSISGQTMAIVFSSLTILYLRPSVYMYKGKAIVFRPSVDMFIGRHGPIVQHCSLPGLVSCCNALGGFVSNITIPSVLDHILPMSYYTSNQY